MTEIEKKLGQVDLNNSSRLKANKAGLLFVDSFNAASKCFTIVSIACNADFIAFNVGKS